ncbi:hypothetical protein P168DRAFT_310787 [Aspergillus campestris IBT 28561]|uniref:Capsule polysaccharide biosynthesis protein n=1 Tax=Aspergillus campestris (strain IBT 28561) TaxID=1392248 RepID=A0A2I1D2L4_ASPC2|nr:uncharacterized protein P168DRAFT_310787 [Aspergillus campestris IBT 28561]PKY04115.1 hypothetical protein P168DRAFT_310787 [Aspergillus campestris IBT 28561]
MEFVRSLAGSLWSSVSFWKAVAIGFALFNLKNLPLVWHIRVYRYFFKHGYLINPAVKPPPSPSSSFLEPKSIFTRAPIMELDSNMHKSNSTYFSDLDVSRTALISSVLMKGVSFLEKQLKEDGKKGLLGFILGSVYTNFKREIPPYMKYEVQSHIASYDEKWIYIVTYFLKPKSASSKKKEETEEQRQKRVLALAISKYVLKKGRYTVPPKDAFEAAGYVPLCPVAGVNGDANGHATGVEANGSAIQRKESASGTGSEVDHQAEWVKLQDELIRGRAMVQPFIDQEEKLLDDYMHKMALPAFA